MSQSGLEAKRVTGAKRGKTRVCLISFTFILFRIVGKTRMFDHTGQTM